MPNLFDIRVVYEDFWLILKFLPTTLEISAAAMVIGLVLGFILAVLHMRRIPVIKQCIDLFISFIRGTPTLVQLYATYFGIPILIKYINYMRGTDIQVANVPPILYAIAALALSQAALNAVTIQASLQAVNKGEIEAAAALGMTGSQRMMRIIIPEAIELAIPSLGNTLIGLIKGTSLAFSCSVIEMAAQGKIVAARDYRYFESYVALAVIYWFVTIVVEQIIRLILKTVQVPDMPKEEKKKFSLHLTSTKKAKGGAI